jgi:two-component system, chemotaxis family, chemotaxis protein CheY
MAHILVVEDEPTIRLLIRRVLEIAGHTVVEAEDGAEGLQILRTRLEPFALLVLDIQMPKMDGFRVLDQLRLKPYAIPIIVLTEHRDLCAQAEKYGADGCLIKPFDRKQLVDWVNRLTDS